MMCGSPEPSLPGGRIQSHRTRGAPEPSQQVWSHDTRGGTGAVLIRRRDPEPLDTWCTGALPAGPEPRYTWLRRSPSYQGGGIQSRWTCGAPEPSQRVQSHGTRDSDGALLIKEAESRAAKHVAASKPTLTGRYGSVLQVTWRRMDACPAPYLDLKIIYRGTQSIRCLILNL
jgi:hypothetical protein